MNNHFDQDIDQTPATNFVAYSSKSEQKAAAEELRIFSHELLELVPAKFDKLNIPDELRFTVNEVRKITSHAARKRALKRVERALEDVDVAALRKAITKIDHQRKPKTAPIKSEAEILADKLISGDDADLFALVDQFGRDSVAQIRTALRQCRKASNTPAQAIESKAALIGLIKDSLEDQIN
jgi:ribosome-associated protein